MGRQFEIKIDTLDVDEHTVLTDGLSIIDPGGGDIKTSTTHVHFWMAAFAVLAREYMAEKAKK
jgi:hypothetical protein